MDLTTPALACAREQTLPTLMIAPRVLRRGRARRVAPQLALQVDDALARISIILGWLLVLTRFTGAQHHVMAIPHAAHHDVIISGHTKINSHSK